MAEANMTPRINLDQLANALSQVSFIINHEGQNLCASDVYSLCADVQDALTGLITVAGQIERQEQARIEQQVQQFDRDQRIMTSSCEL